MPNPTLNDRVTVRQVVVTEFVCHLWGQLAPFAGLRRESTPLSKKRDECSKMGWKIALNFCLIMN